MCEPFNNKEIYRQAIGSLQYLASNSRPDIAVSVSILARCVIDPRKPDWTEVKRIFRYLNGTTKMKLKLGDKNDWKQQQLIAYADAKWSGDSENRKSNTGFLFGYFGAPISWTSHKQSIIALSSTETEYVALSEASQKSILMRRLLQDLNQYIIGPTIIHKDNQSCITMLTNEKSSQRMKHIDTKYHFVKDIYKQHQINIKYCSTDNMVTTWCHIF